MEVNSQNLSTEPPENWNDFLDVSVGDSHYDENMTQDILEEEVWVEFRAIARVMVGILSQVGAEARAMVLDEGALILGLKALVAYEQGDFPAALFIRRPLAGQGDAHAQYDLVLQLQFHVTILAPSVMTPSRYPLMPTAPFAPSQHLLHAVPHPQH